MEILPLKWAPQVPRTRERETTDPKPTMISPGKAIKPPIHLDGVVGVPQIGGCPRCQASAQERNARFSSKWTLSLCTKRKLRDTTLFLYLFSYVG